LEYTVQELNLSVVEEASKYCRKGLPWIYILAITPTQGQGPKYNPTQGQGPKNNPTQGQGPKNNPTQGQGPKNNLYVEGKDWVDHLGCRRIL